MLQYKPPYAGALSVPSIPDIPGLASFKGAAFHSAKWDHSYDLHGKRVAVIGTGASAIQVIPAIQPLVEKLYVFQRTPGRQLAHLKGTTKIMLQRIRQLSAPHSPWHPRRDAEAWLTASRIALPEPRGYTHGQCMPALLGPSLQLV